MHKNTHYNDIHIHQDTRTQTHTHIHTSTQYDNVHDDSTRENKTFKKGTNGRKTDEKRDRGERKRTRFHQCLQYRDKRIVQIKGVNW